MDLVQASAPQRTSLTGRYIAVVPLDAKLHTQPLYEKSHGAEAAALWRYMASGPYPDKKSFARDFEQRAESFDPLFFALVPHSSGEAEGCASYLRIEPRHAAIEVGHILFTPSLQHTRAATEAMYLMARYVFEDLGYRRYEWKCNALNAPSRSAAERLGFSYEGVFRQHMIVKGKNRDTAWYSMLDREWPLRQAAFLEWLDEANFDGEGRQIRRLSELQKQA